ncbi:putative cytochrome P450 301a1, mitochondrial isoform X2 [Haemaphysalis longicornis]
MYRVLGSKHRLAFPRIIGASQNTFSNVSEDRLLETRLLTAKPFSEVPRIPSLPLIGTSWFYCPIIGASGNLHKAEWEMYRRYGPIVAEENPGRQTVVHLFSADDFRTLYQYEGKVPHRSGLRPLKAYHKAKPECFPNAGILNVQGEEWRHVRGAVQSSTIRPKTVRSYASILNKTSDDTLKMIAAHRDENGEVKDCNEIMQRWSLESAISVALRTSLGLLEHPLPEDSDGSVILRCTDDLVNIMDSLMVRIPFSHYFEMPTVEKFKLIAKELSPRMLRVFHNALSSVCLRDESGDDFTILQRLQNDNKLVFNEMFTFVHDFLVASTHTTSAVATFCLYRLAKHPEAQEKARLEALSSLDECLEGDTPVNLPYLQACIKESLRIHPVVPGVDRKLDRDVVMSGYRIPANTEMRTILSVAGRLEENFTNASQFVPERWMRPNEKDAEDEDRKAWTLHPFASIPFSMGPRMCIGRRISELELSILLAKVLRKYRVENHHGDIGFYTRFMSRPERAAKFRFVDLLRPC